MKLSELLESKNDLHFGFEDKSNAAKTEAALKAAGIKCQPNSNAGIYYFNFDSAKDMKAAVKIAQGVIDFSQESEWIPLRVRHSHRRS
jgi:hypothetical protein